MTSLTSSVSFVLSLLTVGADTIIVAAVLLLLFFPKSSTYRQRVTELVSKHAILLSFIVATVATLGSLFYSDIAGYTPCVMCWYQRIVMYPQTVLLGIALWRKDVRIWWYSLPLSIIGVVLAGYHYYLQLGGPSPFPCSAIGQSVSCSKRFVLNFGYITIPMMALSAFVLIMLCMIALRQKHK